MSNQQNIDAFFQVFTDRVEQMKAAMHTIIEVEVLNQTTENFEKESFEGKKWPVRKDKKNKKKLLVKHGHLWKSVRMVSSSPGRMVFGSDLPYAAIHNNGGTINRSARQTVVSHKRYSSGRNKGKTLFHKNNERATYSQKASVGAYTITMPQRQFLGVGPKLRSNIEKVIKEEFEARFK